MPVVSCAKTSLPRSLDVPVSLSRSVAETATDMTMMCFVTPGVAFPPGNDRVQFFSTFEAVQGAVPENSEAIFAAQAFFNRSDRPQTMCIGRVFTAPTNGALVSGSITLSNLASVQNGGFTISVGDTSYTVANLTFGLNPTMADVTRQLNAQMSAFANTVANADGKSVTITTNATGDGADISYAGTPTEFTDVSTLLKLTSATGASIAEGQASTPAKLTSGEITLADLYNVTDGAMTLDMNGATLNLHGLNFATYGSSLTLNEVVQILTAAIGSSGLVETSGQSIVISTSQQGADVTIGYARSASSITDLSAILALTQSTAAWLSFRPPLVARVAACSHGRWIGSIVIRRIRRISLTGQKLRIRRTSLPAPTAFRRTILRTRPTSGSMPTTRGTSRPRLCTITIRRCIRTCPTRPWLCRSTTRWRTPR